MTNNPESNAEEHHCPCENLDKQRNDDQHKHARSETNSEENQAEERQNSHLATFTLFMLPVLLLFLGLSFAEGLLPEGVVYSWWVYNSLHIILRFSILFFIGLAAATPFIISWNQDPAQPLFHGKTRITRALYTGASSIWILVSSGIISLLLILSAHGVPFIGLYVHSTEPPPHLAHHVPPGVCSTPGYYCYETDSFDPDESQLYVFQIGTFTMEKVYVSYGSQAHPTHNTPAAKAALNAPEAPEHSCHPQRQLALHDGQWIPQTPLSTGTWVDVPDFPEMKREKNLVDYVRHIPGTSWSVLTTYSSDSKRTNYLVSDATTHWKFITLLPFNAKVVDTGILQEETPFIEITEPEGNYSTWIPFDDAKEWYCVPQSYADTSDMMKWQNPSEPQGE